MAGFADCKPDPAMLRRARRGDMKAHEVLYRSYGGPVYTLATRLLGDRSMADEVLQETSIEVIRHLRTFREDAAFG
ncbi:MAG: sigma factor, partial [Gammaproteobacteria bacterium]